MTTNKRIVCLPVFGLCLALLCASGCRRAALPAGRNGFALDTAVSITLYALAEGAPAPDALLDGCFAELDRYERLFSAEREGSDIDLLNRAEGRAAPLSAETIEVLQAGLRYGELTGGALDITIRPASRLWDFHGSPSLPDPAALSAAVSLVDYRGQTVEGDTARLSHPDAAVDLGGIAKGYIADRLVSYLTENGVESALIDLGGNISAVGSNDGADWRIGIRDPADETALAAVIPVRNASVVTSGTYERGFVLDGVRYHHLLDPKTGWPVQNGLASVTIVSSLSVDGDALSTACFVLGEEKAMDLIESLPGIEALFIRDSGALSATSGLHYTLPAA